MKPVLVGQAPSRSGNASAPLTAKRVASRLSSCAGLSLEEYARAFDRRNLLDAWPGRSGKGDNFPKNEARNSVFLMMEGLRKRNVLFLGKQVAKAFGVFEDFLVEFEWNEGRAVVLPHPSGINLWWNSEANRALASDLLKRWLAKENK